MNLQDELLREYSKAHVLRLADYIGEDGQRMSALMQLFFEGDYRLNQRASAVVNAVGERHPDMLRPYLEKMVMNLYREGLHDAVKRNTVRLLQFLDIPESLQGHVADRCFRYLASIDEPVAVKVFSMSVLEKIARQQPDLQNELRLLIEDQMPYGSAGFRSRGLKILKRLKTN